MAQSEWAATFRNEHEAPPVTVDSLLAHYRAYGLDNTHTGYRGKAETYPSYRKAREDSLLHVAKSRLTEAAYLQVLEAVGYGKWQSDASTDWRQLHEG